MALDGIVLDHIVNNLKDRGKAKINKIYQISKNEVLFQLRYNNEKQNLLVSCHSIYNRIALTSQSFPTPEEPSSFVMLLRKYLEGSLILDITQPSLDRWCYFDIEVRNTIGDKVVYRLYIELMGKYANIILVDNNNRIIDSLKRIPPFENNTRTIQPGAIFKETAIQEEKINPYNATTYNPDIPLHKQFLGFSPFLGKEVEYRLSNNESFKDIVNKLKNSDKLYFAKDKEEIVFHLIPITHLNGLDEGYDIFDGLDMVYYHLEEKERIKDISGDIYRCIKKELKHYQTKLPKLQESFNDSLDCDKWRIYGDTLYANTNIDTKGLKEVKLQDFEGNNIVVPLDQKLDLKGNAKKCFQKYNKLKKGQVYIQEQIDICKEEIDYLEGINEMIDIASFNDAKEIADELSKNGYMKAKQVKIRKKPKEQIPNITTINLEDGITISFGKNNIQNDYLTFKLAHKNDTWLHAKDYHGAHVIINTSDPDEKTLRLAANIASYYSKGRYSSSVPVNYCLVGKLKKIPKSKLGLVQLTNYNTIYIDPNEEEIEKLIQK